MFGRILVFCVNVGMAPFGKKYECSWIFMPIKSRCQHQTLPSSSCLDIWWQDVHMGVSKNRGTPKWMVYNGKPYLNGWFGGTTIFGNIHSVSKKTCDPLVFSEVSASAEGVERGGSGVDWFWSFLENRTGWWWNHPSENCQISNLPQIRREKLVPLGKYQRYIPTYTTCIWLTEWLIGQYGVIFWEQLLGYPPKGTQFFPLTSSGWKLQNYLQ